ncbi:MAG: hypothetical protein ACFFEA_04145 [Candidatus Thorarchaeota archaeon]
MSKSPEQLELLTIQKDILRVMRRSHRFLMGYIFSSVFGMYIVMLWVILVIAMMDLPLELLSIATIIIVLPILIAPLQYKSAKERFGVLQQAGDSLKEIAAALNEQHIVSGLTSYIFLIFDVLRPIDASEDLASENEIENLRKHLGNLTKRVISEVAFQGFLYTLLIINFLIPEFISAIEQGSPLLFPMIFLCVVLAILIARWFIFFYWRILVRRWLKFYQGFVAWGEELDRIFSTSASDHNGGVFE